MRSQRAALNILDMPNGAAVCASRAYMGPLNTLVYLFLRNK
jgi:hypothetical protein